MRSRLGGGRWETKDGRFQIEPQSGTWVIVDTTQTNEFGLPLVRGPFGSLTAAREAIETARDEGPVESPLAERIEQARQAPEDRPSDAESPKPAGAKRTAVAGAEAVPTKKALGGGRRGRARRTEGDEDAAAAEPEPKAEPEPPPEPKWIRELGATDRRNARRLIDASETSTSLTPRRIARAEFARREPAVARVALERQASAATRSAKTPRSRRQGRDRDHPRRQGRRTRR